ncbi:23S rRNA (pseudouridine(1915)-N(3))-methyltransferase RlmH [Candidatus Odyssella thessalonicensis]|uniref:23S rRNA (pseudouridine(1915)-N(3))-methyltransferase RlmH n=1 Tax=Candidatus Odyssella thessalonicensis TaxID=84647 RepID=UPI000225AF71|nr:23S rRNA (pseudouridine(1915)-N(3))-methyltransferase RlmH [Candidatus Odyssella thessalonicensis]
MKIRLICIGTLKKSPELELINEYLKRCRWKIEIKELTTRSDLTGESLKQFEADQILGHLADSIPLIALDERGHNPSSRELAKTFQELQNTGHSQVTLCIGGADGLHQSVRDRAWQMISFGRLTWPHMLVRVMLMEQLYRVQQILSGHPYHRD